MTTRKVMVMKMRVKRYPVKATSREVSGHGIFKNFYFDLFVTSPSLFTLLCSRLRRDYFPILRDPSRSSLTSRDASRFSRYFLPMPPYSFIIFPMRTTIILLVHSTLIVIFLSPLMSFFPSLCSLLRSHGRNKCKTNTIGDPNCTTIDLLAPPTEDYHDPDPWQETGVRLLPLEPRG